MFGKKQKQIKLLEAHGSKYFDLYFNTVEQFDAAQTQVTNLTAQLQFSEEETQKLNEENRDLQIRLELLQSVLKQLNIPVKLKK